MNRNAGLLISVLFLILSTAVCQERQAVFDESGFKGLPVFRHNIFRSVGPAGEYVLNLHAEMTNERLQFRKSDSLYEASYTISAALFGGSDVSGIPLFQEQQTKNIRTAAYRETQSARSANRHIFKFPASEGSYTAVIMVKDENSGKSHKVKKEIGFGPATETVVSDIRMVFWTDDSDFENSYSDLINNVVDKKNDYTGALFEIFSSQGPMKFSLRYRITDSSGSVVYDDKFEGSMKDRIQYQVLKIPLDKLLAGNYRIDMDINIGGLKLSRNAVFYLRWGDLSMNVSDINKALEQMLYIVDYDSMQTVFEMSDDLKKEWFKDYWNGLEASLELKTNSLMEEYYRRVAYANLHFSVPHKDGWKTDMGKVLCMMGDPDEVQSYPFAKNQKPYEVWIYYDLNVQYIFDYVAGEHRLRK